MASTMSREQGSKRVLRAAANNVLFVVTRLCILYCSSLVTGMIDRLLLPVGHAGMRLTVYKPSSANFPQEHALVLGALRLPSLSKAGLDMKQQMLETCGITERDWVGGSSDRIIDHWLRDPSLVHNVNGETCLLIFGKIYAH